MRHGRTKKARKLLNAAKRMFNHSQKIYKLGWGHLKTATFKLVQISDNSEILPAFKF